MNEKPASWNDCLEKNMSLNARKDMLKSKSLIETALHRIAYVNKDLNENTANYIFEDYYTSIVELLEAMAIVQGYKVLNHVCLGFFLRDVMKKDSLFRIFDELRYKRNSLVYYGKRMQFEEAKMAIEKSKRAAEELRKLTGDSEKNASQA
jgi:hypothetical protein